MLAVASIGTAAATTLATWQQVFSRNPYGLFYAAVVVTHGPAGYYWGSWQAF